MTSKTASLNDENSKNETLPLELPKHTTLQSGEDLSKTATSVSSDVDTGSKSLQQQPEQLVLPLGADSVPTNELEATPQETLATNHTNNGFNMWFWKRETVPDLNSPYGAGIVSSTHSTHSVNNILLDPNKSGATPDDVSAAQIHPEPVVGGNVEESAILEQNVPSKLGEISSTQAPEGPNNANLQHTKAETVSANGATAIDANLVATSNDVAIKNDTNALTDTNAANTTITETSTIGQVVAEGQVIATAATYQWFSWTYTSAVSYLSQANEPEATETTPLVHKSSEASLAPVNEGWFGWIWGTKATDEEEDDDDEDGRKEHVREAKQAVELALDTVNYAFKYAVQNESRSKLLEIAVVNTSTQQLPVRYKYKKKPLTTNEAQERTFQTLTYKKTEAEQQELDKKADLVLPDIDKNFRVITTKTQLRLVFEDILSLRKKVEAHLYKLQPNKVCARKQRVRKIVIIGVHGFLPTKMVRSIIGQSSGSSLTLVKAATKALKQWLQQDDINLDEYDINTIALEGMGKIADRVEMAMVLLENWMETIQQADFVFFVSYSQGTVIAMHILARLLQQITCKRVGFLGMAGLMQGPISGLEAKSPIRSYTAVEKEVSQEMVELQLPESALSQQLVKSMEILIEHNVKITFAASVNDQFVPLTSALANQFNHGNIYRVLYVDKENDVPQFVVTLFEIILIMKNKGSFNDHNLLRDICERCIGNYTSGGHGKIFNEANIYATAIKQSLETTNLPIHNQPLKINNEKLHSNLYLLPWNVRGLLQDLVKLSNVRNLQLISRLQRDFNSWEPTLKQWREIKFAFDAFAEMDLEELML